MLVLNPHVKWRKEAKEILICDCKRLVDLKISLEFENVLKKFEAEFKSEELLQNERLLFSDLNRLKMISSLEIKLIKLKDFDRVMEIFNIEFNNMVRTRKFLISKFKKFPEFFIGLFIDNYLQGIICGFPREDYLLISEIAIRTPLKGRGFGKKLVQEFENNAKSKYRKINVGAEDEVIGFYENLGYSPFLLIQSKPGICKETDFKNLEIIRKYRAGGQECFEFKIKKVDLSKLNILRKIYPKVNFQYIFTKRFSY
jgi:GNAT superfamily N-acetyltransferase